METQEKAKSKEENLTFEQLVAKRKKEEEKKEEEITYEKLLALLNGFNLNANLRGKSADLAICISKNLPVIQSEMKIFEDVAKELTKYSEYEEKVKEVKEKYADKDASGEPIIIIDELNGTSEYDVPEKKKDALWIELKALKDKYKKDIKAREELLKKVCDIRLSKIQSNKLPSEITPKQAASIELIIRYSK